MKIAFLDAIPAQEKRITISTIFTLIRIALIPIIVIAMIGQSWHSAGALFMIAAATDIIDGMLARLLNERTVLGACLDALADKFLLISCFGTLAYVKSPFFEIPSWFVIMVVIKELMLVGGALWVYAVKGTITVAPTALGKAAMFAQVCFIMGLYGCYFLDYMPLKLYDTALWFVVFLIMAALLQYILIGCRYVFSSFSLV